MPERAALIAVYDKEGVVELARGLADLDFKIISTGGTAKVLRRGRVRVQEVAALTGFPEMLGGRVKTLHPRVFGGILARPTAAHRRELKRRRITAIDVVAVNLYPFERTSSRRGCSEDDAVEHIDIGGVALLRAGAKNFERVAVLSSPSQYADALARIAGGADDADWRRGLARGAFELTAGYDAAIANYFARGKRRQLFPADLVLNLHKVIEPGYGENPHQRAAFYAGDELSLRQLAGPPPSYNNFLDMAAAAALAEELERPSCVVVKHNSPCGAASAGSGAEAFRRAWHADALSAYGGIVAFNCAVDDDTAATMMAKGTFFHICVAPSFRPDVVEYLCGAKAWTDRLRIFAGRYKPPRLEYRSVLGGVLAQEADRLPARGDRWRQVAGPAVDDATLADLGFAWAVAKHARSNAVVIAHERTTLAIGAGAVNRLWPAEDAVRRAGEAARGAVAASDGFFPKPDTPEVLCRAGVGAIVQPEGSKGDEQVVELAKKYGVALFFAEKRHFRH